MCLCTFLTFHVFFSLIRFLVKTVERCPGVLLAFCLSQGMPLMIQLWRYKHEYFMQTILKNVLSLEILITISQYHSLHYVCIWFHYYVMWKHILVLMYSSSRLSRSFNIMILLAVFFGFRLNYVFAIFLSNSSIDIDSNGEVSWFSYSLNDIVLVLRCQICIQTPQEIC